MNKLTYDLLASMVVWLEVLANIIHLIGGRMSYRQRIFLEESSI